MGTYLNPGNDNFRVQVENGTYVDKTMLIEETNKRLNDNDFKFLCISRPRRFGKSIAENMLAAYYSKGADSRTLFAPYKISQAASFEKNLNKFNVIHIDLNALYSEWIITIHDPSQENIPEQQRRLSFIPFVTKKLCAEFKKEFKDVAFEDGSSVASSIQQVFAQKHETFIVIIDEYDVLVREQVPQSLFKTYLEFLSSLFKNSTLKPAISLAYLTGILPIMKDKVQSKMNEFDKITMLDADDFAEFTGFTTEEVKALCKKYNCDFEECKSWYDGYNLKGVEIYNPQAVIKAVPRSKFKSYWSETSSYEVVAEKIRMNFAGTKEDVITMMGGGRVGIEVEAYENTMSSFNSKDDVFTYLIHLGYLAYDEKEKQCYIPNKEIYEEWKRVVKNTSDYSETNKIISDSEQLLRDTIAMNEEAVARGLDAAHRHVTSYRNYNNEYALHAAIYLAYIYAMNNYIIAKELPAGNGCADIVYIPFDKTKETLIVELKYNGSASKALEQIKSKKYFDLLEKWNGGILFVGVNYDAESKTHECKIERFEK